MTRTLADMTPSECVGMWCEDQDGDLVVLHCVHESRVDGQVAVVVFHPPSGDRLRYLASELTPRLDLPRAWTPDGKPVPGTWDDDNGHNSMRRFRSEWEWKHDTPQHIIDQHTKVTP